MGAIIKEMKTLTIGDVEYEIVDAKARANIEAFGMQAVAVSTRKNLIDLNAITTGGWHYNGAVEMYAESAGNDFLKNYCFTDYIPVEGGAKYVYSNVYPYDTSLTYLHSYSYFDKDKNFISSTLAPFDGGYTGEYYAFDVPTNAAYIIINAPNVTDFLVSQPQLEKGETPTEYEEYISDAEIVSGYRLPALVVKQEQVEGLEEFDLPTIKEQTDKLKEIDLLVMQEQVNANAEKLDEINPEFVERKNLIYTNAITKGGWYNNGKADMYPDNPYVEKYCFTDYIPVIGGEKHVYSGGERNGNRTYLHSFSYFDKDKAFISSTLPLFNGDYYVFDIPENVAYVIINDANYELFLSGQPQFEKGDTPTEYEEYIPDEELAGYYMPDLKVKAEQIEDFVLPETEYNILHLPEKYDLVVGDNFELFYKGIMLCKDPYSYNIHVQCNIGKAWGRKFEVTPTAAGNYTLNIAVSDDNGKVLDAGSTILSVSPKMTAPSKNVNVLCIGDSLTEGGVWVDEVYRRLTKTTDRTQYNHEAPTGDGLANINFLGKRTTANGAGYEGNGGWKFANYNDTSTAVNAYWVTATHNKTDSDQESVYADANGVKWQLETIEAGRLKFKKYAGEGTMDNNGVLTWISGGVNVDAINYNGVSPEEGNPFVYDGIVDFAAYCDDIGASSIDKCFILLGWNNAATSEDEYKADAKAFIDKLIAFNTNIKVTLIGLQIPSLDGCANNYGASGVYTNYRGLQEFVFNLDKWYSDIAAEYPSNVDTINLSGQFDTEHNSITAEFAVNSRNPQSVAMQSNGVHPSTFGYYQIADAVYRKFTADNT